MSLENLVELWCFSKGFCLSTIIHWNLPIHRHWGVICVDGVQISNNRFSLDVSSKNSKESNGYKSYIFKNQVKLRVSWSIKGRSVSERVLVSVCENCSNATDEASVCYRAEIMSQQTRRTSNESIWQGTLSALGRWHPYRRAQLAHHVLCAAGIGVSMYALYVDVNKGSTQSLISTALNIVPANSLNSLIRVAIFFLQNFLG